MQSQQQLPATPFTVIAGFLGAGKTTLLNQLLRNSLGVRYAVLVNDFGAINIDSNLIEQHDGQTLSLSNGCICCSIAEGFISTLIKLTENRAQFDHIVVECSGVTEPQRIMDIAKLDPELQADAIITLVDAANIEHRLSDQKINTVVRSQLRSADIVLLNKMDLIHHTQHHVIQALIATLNPQAHLLQCQYANIPIHTLLGTARLPQSCSPPISEQPSLSATMHAEHHTTTSDNKQAQGFFSLSAHHDDSLDRHRFEQLPLHSDPHILRAKGILYFSEEPQQAWNWQRVGQRQTIEKIDNVNSNKHGHGHQSSCVMISTNTLNTHRTSLQTIFRFIT